MPKKAKEETEWVDTDVAPGAGEKTDCVKLGKGYIAFQLARCEPKKTRLIYCNCRL